MDRVRSGLRLPMDMNEQLLESAKKKGISKNALILTVLNEWIQQQERKNSSTIDGEMK